MVQTCCQRTCRLGYLSRFCETLRSSGLRRKNRLLFEAPGPIGQPPNGGRIDRRLNKMSVVSKGRLDETTGRLDERPSRFIRDDPFSIRTSHRDFYRVSLANRPIGPEVTKQSVSSVSRHADYARSVPGASTRRQ